VVYVVLRQIGEKKEEIDQLSDQIRLIAIENKQKEVEVSALEKEKFECNEKLAASLAKEKEQRIQIELLETEHRRSTEQFLSLRNEFESEMEKLKREISHSGNEAIRLRQQLSLSQTTMNDVNVTLNETIQEKQALESEKKDWELKYHELNRSTSLAMNTFHSLRSDIESKYQLEVEDLNQKLDANEKRLEETKQLLMMTQSKFQCETESKVRLEAEYPLSDKTCGTSSPIQRNGNKTMQIRRDCISIGG
jgi:chromosome segregation ATPase